MNILVAVVVTAVVAIVAFCGGVVHPAQLCAQAQSQNQGHDQARRLEDLQPTAALPRFAVFWSRLLGEKYENR